MRMRMRMRGGLYVVGAVVSSQRGTRFIFHKVGR